MKYIFYISFFTIATHSLAINVERKIIIDHNQFYFTTIDDENQIATLHQGKISQPLDSAILLALPAGRNYDYPINPFAWDVSKDNFYAISFLNHPLNSKMEALKRFPLSSLQPWSDKTILMDLIMKSVDQNMFTRNDPYLYTITKSNILDHFFYDAIAMNDTSYIMAITNNYEISIWNYNEKKWEHGADQKFSSDNYFSLFKWNKKLYLVTGEGTIYSVKDYHLTLIQNKTLGDVLDNCIIIENRDDNTISVIKKNKLNFKQPLDKELIKKAVKLF